MKKYLAKVHRMLMMRLLLAKEYLILPLQELSFSRKNSGGRDDLIKIRVTSQEQLA